MAMDTNRGSRETGSRRARLDRVSDLGRISMLRKKSRLASMNVAAEALLWDRRRVARTAERRVRRRLVLEPARHLAKGQGRLMLTTMTGWGYDRPSQMFTPTRSLRRDRSNSSDLARAQFIEVHRHLSEGCLTCFWAPSTPPRGSSRPRC